ncbi:MAG: Veg family protein [Clostridia bacterium]|nr:Veg family protein [Clostridia bacterium]MDD4679715.1 Veg family protein [Clostridia bacterium]
MIDAEALTRVRRVLESNVGQKVRLKANRGRRKSYIKEGVICDTYLNLFTVQVDIDTRTVQTLAYTYSDVLTSNVELVKCSDNKRLCTG